MTKEKKLTLKQTKFIKYYFECDGNATEAARRAKYKGNSQTLQSVGKENLTKPLILTAIEEIKKKNGLTEELLLKKHLQLLNAKRVQSCDVYITEENGKLKLNENSNDFIEVEDNFVQLGALKLAYEINGKLKRKEEERPLKINLVQIIKEVSSNGKLNIRTEAEVDRNIPFATDTLGKQDTGDIQIL